MSFEEILTTILSQGIPASVVLQAIHDGLLEVNKSSVQNIRTIKELQDLMVVLQESHTTDASSPEVILARGGRENLKARVDEFELRLNRIDTEIELKRPYRETKTKTIIVPFETTIEYDATVYYSDSYVKTPGVNGSKTITYEEEFINGVSTGRVFNETVTSEVAPKNEVKVVGTKVANPKPIRYIRFSNAMSSQVSGRWSELEVFVNGNNIAPTSKATFTPGSTAQYTNHLFNGQKDGYSTVINGVTNPWVQLDFGTTRTDITEISFTLPPRLNFKYAYVDISADGINWSRVYSQGAFYSKEDDYKVGIGAIYGAPISQYTDLSSSPEAQIGGYLEIVASPIRLYWDSDRALTRNTYQSGMWYQKGSHKVLNKRTVNGVTVYGLSIGWIRADDNR